MCRTTAWNGPTNSYRSLASIREFVPSYASVERMIHPDVVGDGARVHEALAAMPS